MSETNINDLIFKELIKRGYSLHGNTRVWNIADSKLWYLTPEQAQEFLDLEKQANYQQSVIQKEIELIHENLGTVLEKVGEGKINIIDIGCGDGKKAVLFISSLRKKGNVKIGYCPIDISDYMVEKALEKIKKQNVEEIIEFQWNISDFENLENVAGMIRSQRSGNNLFLLLGNTLGNFEINELLYEIRSSMKEGEVLVIGNGLSVDKKIDETLKAYNNPEVNDWLVQIITQLGFNEDEVQYNTRFANSRIEMFYKVMKSKKIRFLDKEVSFNVGDEIIVAVSYKYDVTDFKGLMGLYFDDVEVFTSPDSDYALVVCKK